MCEWCWQCGSEGKSGLEGNASKGGRVWEEAKEGAEREEKKSTEVLEGFRERKFWVIQACMGIRQDEMRRERSGVNDMKEKKI